MRRSGRRRLRRSPSCSARKACRPPTRIRSRASPSTTRSPKRSTRCRWCTARSPRKFSGNRTAEEISMQRSQPFTLAVPVNHTDHVQGTASAKVTVVEYGDFECPSCGQAYPAVKMLLKHFGERVRFVFRHFPLLEVHPHAELAAETAEAAGAQNKFWQMHDLLFENQLHLKANNLREYAQRAELDLERYD